jgi:purine-binding chemotaxis protein CheW
VDILLFELEGQRYGLPAERVREVVRMVAIAPLPRAPRAIEGVVNVRGEIVPVYDLRARFDLPPRAPDPAEHLIVLTAGAGPVAIRVDFAESLESVPDKDVSPASSLATSVGGVSTARHVSGVAAMADGVLVIYDLDDFLSTEESAALDGALAPSSG